MRTILIVFSISVSLLSSACGPRFYKPGIEPHQPAEIVVSAYTQDGCVEELQEEASARNVQVKLKDIQTDLGWQIFLFPLYKGYKCTGIVVGPK